MPSNRGRHGKASLQKKGRTGKLLGYKGLRGNAKKTPGRRPMRSVYIGPTTSQAADLKWQLAECGADEEP